MISWIHPALFFFIAAGALPLVKGKAKQIVLFGAPVLALLCLVLFPEGNYGVMNVGGYELILGRVDKMALLFGYIFCVMAGIGMVYALHVRQEGEHIAAYLYIGSALGAILAGDLITLFVFWEIMAFASVFLIWYGGKKAGAPGYRYLLMHIFGGLCLLGGIVVHVIQSGSIAFDALPHNTLGGVLIMIGFLINAGAPPLHAWLPDAYPESTITGIIFLGTYTTKTALYALARSFPGAEVLIFIGLVMAIWGVCYAIMSNNLRRLLSYHIISQMGYMVVAVGIGTEMAINAAVALAFTNILYKGLLLMGAGALIYGAGQKGLSRMGGLAKSMPITFGLFLIGGFSISGLPFLNGFISKSMVISSAIAEKMPIVTLLLTMVAAGTFLSTTLKPCYFAFLAPDKGLKAQEPPRHMLWAMGVVAALCFITGSFPGLLYGLLPHPVEYHPYTLEHIAGSLQGLFFAALAFIFLLWRLHPEDGTTIDVDIAYRRGVPGFMWFAEKPLARYEEFITEVYKRLIIQSTIRWVALCRKFDTRIIDGIVNAVGRVVFFGGWLSSTIEKYVVYGALNLLGYANHVAARILKRLQTGTVNHYAMMIVIGIFVLVNLYLVLKSQIPSLLVLK